MYQAHLVCSVGEVETNDIEASVHQLQKLLNRARHWA